MAASPVEDRVALLDSLPSDEGSFDIIDPNFDPAFSELTGVACADYIPLEADEVLMNTGEARTCARSGSVVSTISNPFLLYVYGVCTNNYYCLFKGHLVYSYCVCYW